STARRTRGGAVWAGGAGCRGGRSVRGPVRHPARRVANPLSARKSMIPKRLSGVRRASSPLRHSLGCPQLDAPGTPHGEKPAKERWPCPSCLASITPSLSWLRRSFLFLAPKASAYPPASARATPAASPPAYNPSFLLPHRT